MRLHHLLAIVLATPLAASAADNKLNTLEKKASYSFGVDFARQLEQQGVNLDIESLARGIKDAAGKKELAMQPGEMSQVKAEFQQKIRAEMLQQQKTSAANNLAEGQAFLAENAKKEGVVTTASGLQYKIIKSGNGATPKPEDTVVTHYKGTLIDGREFDSSYKRNQPATFPVKGVIKGWTEALQLMKVGDTWQLFIPADIAYGESKRSELIQPNSALVFELELLDIK